MPDQKEVQSINNNSNVLSKTGFNNNSTDRNISSKLKYLKKINNNIESSDTLSEDIDKIKNSISNRIKITTGDI